jgi:hypothetical protein
MAGLRDLFGKFEQVTQSEIDAGEVEVFGYDGQVFTVDTMCHNSDNGPNCCDAYQANRIQFWCAPTGTTKIRFEIWGGGGSGASMRGCHGGTPGGSGAWASATIGTSAACVSASKAFVEGDCFDLCSGWGGQWYCCSCIGCRGCKSYVTGSGLNNFCADGGFGGYVYCNCYWRQCCISGPSGDGRGVDYGWHYMGRSGCCTPYYGADEGEYGVPGWYTNYCGCGSDQNNCWIKQWVPHSPGISSKGPTHSGMRVQGNACRNEWAHCSVSGTTRGHYNFPRAGGGMSGTTCGDGQCCGQPGGTGMVRVIYK